MNFRGLHFVSYIAIGLFLTELLFLKRCRPEEGIMENRTGRSLTCDLNLFETKRYSNAHWSGVAFVKLWTASKSHIRWHFASDLGSLWSRSFYISPNCDRLVVRAIMAAFSAFYDQARSFRILSFSGAASFRVRKMSLFWILQTVLICMQKFMTANQWPQIAYF